MDDDNLFELFLQNTLSIANRRVRDEITNFVETFRDLLATTDADIDTFVKETHSSNSARPANAKILIPASSVKALKSLLFELRDRDKCNALPSAPILDNIDDAQLTVMKNNRRTALGIETMRKSQNLPDMAVPKLTSSNFETFNTAFSSAVRRQMSLAGVSLSYLLRDHDVGNYEALWLTREEKLQNCLKFEGPLFQDDTETLYTLLVQHIGTTGVGSNIVIKYKVTKDGRACYVELKRHFQNATYIENKATAANKVIAETKYYGDRRHFTLETYYTLMSQAFLELDSAGVVHTLSEEQKITKFESGLVEDKAISYRIQAKVQWNTFPLRDRTFDNYFNIFSASMNKHNLLTSSHSTRGSRISQVGSNGGRDRGRDRGRGRGRGRSGRGRGARSGSNNPYQMTRTQQGPFTAEARIYPPNEYRNFTREQRQMITDLKVQQGWIDGNTPPPGFTLDADDRPQPSTHLISAIRASIIGEVQSTQQESSSTAIVPLPPPPSNSVGGPIPPVVMTNPSSAGQSFGQAGTRITPTDNSTIATVTVNGRSITGPIFDSNGNRIA